MTRQAKIQISADVQSLKQSVAQAKKTMESLGQVKINNKSLDAIKNSFGKDLAKKITSVTESVGKLEEKIEKLGQKGKSPMSAEFQKSLNKARELKVELENLKKVKDKLDKGEIGVPEAAKKSGGLMKAVTGGVGKVAGVVGLGIGLSELYGTGMKMANQRASLRALTGGSVVGADNTMGYTPEERRQRATSIAGALGRNVSGRELTGLTNFGERLERAYGVDEGTMSGAIKEGRKAGIEDQQKFLATSIGIAVSKGLEGSRIGEYLSAMTGFMSELSDGITVNMDSVNAISSAFGDIPFFKNDFSRLFDQMRGMNQAFTSGDRFQQAQAARAIQNSMGGKGASPAAVELRRSLGLFGGSEELAKTTGIKSLGVSGTDVLSNMFKEMQTSTSGMTKEEQMYEIMSRSGLKGEGGMRIASKIMSGKTAGISEKDIAMAQMSPEEQFKTKVTERLTNTFVKTDSDILKLNSTVQELKEFLANDMLTALSELLKGINAIVNLIPGSETIDKVKTVGRVIEGGALAYGASKIPGVKDGVSALWNGVKNVGSKALPAVRSALPALAEAGTTYGLPALAVGTSAVAGYGVGMGINHLTGNEGQVGEWLYDLLHPDEAGLTPKETKASRSDYVTNSGSGVSFPDTFQTTDPVANQLLGGILQALQGRGPSNFVDNRRGPVGQMGSGKVGMNR